MHNAWTLTISKLNLTLEALEDALETGDYTVAVLYVRQFKDYKDCNYCQTYRTVLQDHSTDCCKSCPLHRYGEKMIGRSISYNGCYKIASYRETVRTSWKFCDEPNDILAKILITNIKECLNQMTIHRAEVEF